MAKRIAIVKRIAVIKRTAKGLGDLFGSEVIDGQIASSDSVQSAVGGPLRRGLTDFCRHLLSCNGSDPMTLYEILAKIQKHCPERLGHHKHPANSLRVVRWVEYGEAEVRTEKELAARKIASGGEAEPNLVPGPHQPSVMINVEAIYLARSSRGTAGVTAILETCLIDSASRSGLAPC